MSSYFMELYVVDIHSSTNMPFLCPTAGNIQRDGLHKNSFRKPSFVVLNNYCYADILKFSHVYKGP